MNTALLIPSYNAAATLPLLLDRVVRFVPAGSVVVVNDGSTDGTGAVAALKGVTVLHHVQNSEPPPTPGLRREGSRGVEKGNY